MKPPIKGEVLCTIHDMTGCALCGYRPAVVQDFDANARAVMAMLAPRPPQHEFTVVPLPTTEPLRDRPMNPATGHWDGRVRSLPRREYPTYGVMQTSEHEHVGRH